MNMIGYLAVVSLILLVQVGAVGAETEVVVYSDDNYLPYAYKEGGQARGIYTEILKKAFARMEEKSACMRAIKIPTSSR